MSKIIPLHKTVRMYRLFYGYSQEYVAFKLGIEQFKDSEIEVLKDLFKIEIREDVNYTI